jgi:hypothetical protein
MLTAAMKRFHLAPLAKRGEESNRKFRFPKLNELSPTIPRNHLQLS